MAGVVTSRTNYGPKALIVPDIAADNAPEPIPDCNPGRPAFLARVAADLRDGSETDKRILVNEPTANILFWSVGPDANPQFRCGWTFHCTIARVPPPVGPGPHLAGMEAC